MYEIVEHYNFVATHEIPGLRPTHPCHGVHMHQWSVEVVLLSAALLPTDGPAETAALEPLRRYVTSELEARHLNDVLIGDPTPVRLAGHLVSWCRCHLPGFVAETLHSVSVSAGRATRGRCIVSRGQGGLR
ncbi:6-carboxy-5,6,7,8-tetrahydropterin synthase [Lentzea sp. NBRC 105346]|uniref:6-carboxytetrahydropterin synthase n=1 Tax=Lentzea sp. NBRC 105346 TaxID=3032205 RepID=UPI0024A0C558|nr:6-carboxytetrahydropterin synthase [Lentzea sp. NBRC 105346]GLZ30116.1 6-carboxy-5,6,7,8-tetrahydropterin synthase [Lentzea sp. NBRC 105346]